MPARSGTSKGAVPRRPTTAAASDAVADPGPASGRAGNRYSGPDYPNRITCRTAAPLASRSKASLSSSSAISCVSSRSTGRRPAR
jgi:hypothetical protein